MSRKKSKIKEVSKVRCPTKDTPCKNFSVSTEIYPYIFKVGRDLDLRSVESVRWKIKIIVCWAGDGGGETLKYKQYGALWEIEGWVETGELKDRPTLKLMNMFQRVIGKLDALTTRCQERSELADFLIQVTKDELRWAQVNSGVLRSVMIRSEIWIFVNQADLVQVASEFEFGIKENWDQINVITMEDRLDALEYASLVTLTIYLLWVSCIFSGICDINVVFFLFICRETERGAIVSQSYKRLLTRGLE